ncbi:hypothetical protein QBC34DRAFT_498867 [Podospora aff. communis PSN243]|uniref:Uncharacterized protein n=1 Tax=Podospora aff. communis PSN243 TaxID=3040156 RepID=A0AAV9G625_9PEZI|nr:hypothetical protein QBC34DRAFT_498867 [Podospora aff. communis PSN243]
MASNVTNDEILGWVQEPDGRGTFSILKSCVITLVLCVYTALHLNIPPGNSSATFLFWRKTKWILVGLFAPEILVYVAWFQRRRVKRLSKELTAIFKEGAEKDPKLKRTHDWTTTHSWFTYMGGFAIDTNQGQEDLPGEYIPGSPRIVLSKKAVAVLARVGMLPDISKGSIKDKSKADSLAKALVITQASWLILQCIMRFANRLPVTVLELNTLAHAVCALLIYALWWEKPLDVTEPHMLTADWAPDFAATLWCCTRHKGQTDVEVDVIRWIGHPWAEQMQKASNPEGHPEQTATSTGAVEAGYAITIIETREKSKTTYDLGVHDIPSPILFTDPVAAQPPLAPFQYGERDRIVVATTPAGDVLLAPRRLSKPHGIYNVDLTHLIRWQLLTRFVIHHPEVARLMFRLPSSDLNISTRQTSWILPLGIRHLLKQERGFFLNSVETKSGVTGWRMAIPSVSNWPNPESRADDKTAGHKSLAVFWMAALVYGAIHALAWNDHFATPTEALLWKISCIYVAGYGSIVMGVVTTWQIASRFKSDRQRDFNTHLRSETPRALAIVQDSWKKFRKSPLGKCIAWLFTFQTYLHQMTFNCWNKYRRASEKWKSSERRPQAVADWQAVVTKAAHVLVLVDALGALEMATARNWVERAKVIGRHFGRAVRARAREMVEQGECDDEEGREMDLVGGPLRSLSFPKPWPLGNADS